MRGTRSTSTSACVQSPTSTSWNEDGGGWTGFAAGIDSTTGASIAIDYDKDVGVGLGDPETVNYPVVGNCQFQNAALVNPWSRFPRRPGGGRQPTLRRIMYPPIDVSPWSSFLGAPERLNEGGQRLRALGPVSRHQHRRGPARGAVCAHRSDDTAS